MEKHKTIANTIANMASKIWSMVSIYIFVPLYIKYLGEEAYGLISFFTTMQMALNLLGLGLSSTLRREFALNINGGYEVNLRKYKLLRSIEVFFYSDSYNDFSRLLQRCPIDCGEMVGFFCAGYTGGSDYRWVNGNFYSTPAIVPTIFWSHARIGKTGIGKWAECFICGSESSRFCSDHYVFLR